MDELIKKAREQRERAIQQRDELTAIINSLDQFITNYEKALAKAGGASPPEVRQADLFARPVNRAERTRQVAHMMDLAAELIHAAGHPLTRSELLEELEGRGFRIEGGDKSKVLGTNLWRSKRFHNLKGVGYWPKETPLPEAFAHFQLRPSMLTDD